MIEKTSNPEFRKSTEYRLRLMLKFLEKGGDEILVNLFLDYYFVLAQMPNEPRYKDEALALLADTPDEHLQAFQEHLLSELRQYWSLINTDNKSSEQIQFCEAFENRYEAMIYYYLNHQLQSMSLIDIYNAANIPMNIKHGEYASKFLEHIKAYPPHPSLNISTSRELMQTMKADQQTTGNKLLKPDEVHQVLAEIKLLDKGEKLKGKPLTDRERNTIRTLFEQKGTLSDADLIDALGL